MKQIISLSFFILLFSSCTLHQNNLHLTTFKNIKTVYGSQSGKYLSANYSILQGDYLSTNKILKSTNNDLTLLDLEFFSNLVSGNFQLANDITNNKKFILRNDFLYKIPSFAINLKNNNLKISLKIANHNQAFTGFNKISSLLEYYMHFSELKNNNQLPEYNKNKFKLSIHKLLILENFYNINELKKIADYNNSLESLSSVDLLFLAGFYFRFGDLEKFNEIIKYRLSDKFDKNYILKQFSYPNNIFNKKINFKTIISSYLYHIAAVSHDTKEESSSYINILLEMSIYLCPNMDISKYLLAELYAKKNLESTALDKLNQIDKTSFFQLPAFFKKLSIIKKYDRDKSYPRLLFSLYKKWPNNRYILYELANFYKSKNNYNDALPIYKKLFKIGDKNTHLLFLYAMCLDNLGRWEEAKKIFLTLVHKDNPDPYTLNYLAYSMAIKKENLDFALKLINKALILNVNNGFFLDTIGWIEYQKSNYETSIFYLQKAVFLEPSSSEIIDHLADCYLKLGRKNEALYEWRKALKFANTEEALNLIKNKIIKYE